jgi:hypothetical protein
MSCSRRWLPVALLAVTLASQALLSSATAGAASRVSGRRQAALRILTPAAGKRVKTPTSVPVKLWIWTRDAASLRLVLDGKVVTLVRKQVHIYRGRGGYIWSETLRMVRIVRGSNILTASIRNRRGLRVTATVRFRGPILLRGKDDLDVTGTTVVRNLQLYNASDPVTNLDDTLPESFTHWKEVVPMANLVTTRDDWHVSAASPKFTLGYQIHDQAGTPTGYWLYAVFFVPLFGPNEALCTITTSATNPYTLGAQAPPKGASSGLPFNCAWSNIHGWNPSPVLTVA